MADFASEHFAREVAHSADELTCLEHSCCDQMCIDVKPYTMDKGSVTTWQFYCSACTQIKLIVSDEVFARMEGMNVDILSR